jgi:cell wall-associated NlpC family hydrolase
MTLKGMVFSQGRHARHRSRATAALLSALFVVAATVWSLVGVQSADAAVSRATWGSSSSLGNAAINWAEHNAYRHWYLWGGTGPSYDCSGLVMEAYGHATGIWLPHSTYSMLASRHLVRTYYPQRGDLAFYGSGHVELVTVLYDTTFGAHDSGSRIGWIRFGGSWQPTAYYRVVR